MMVVIFTKVALGQETTSLTTIPLFAHHGMIYVPFGFANAVSLMVLLVSLSHMSCMQHLFDNSEVVGGSAYGAGTVA